jgi:hypothetical protein
MLIRRCPPGDGKVSSDKSRIADIGLMNGFAIVMAKFLRDLHKSGSISKDQFADELDDAIRDLPRVHDGVPRLDVVMVENLVKLLRDQKDPPWTLQVIPGGLSSGEDPRS